MNVISIIGTGRLPAIMAPSKKPDEDRKRTFALALADVAVASIDNVETTFGSAEIAAILTAGEITDRILGESRTMTLALKTIFFATGNNLAFKGDTARRVIPIDLFSKLEFPEDRKDFKYPDLIAHVKEVRPRLVTAALTILKAYALAGKPKTGKPALGSFEDWDTAIRSPLCWIGMDPCATRKRLREEGDDDREKVDAILDGWEKTFGDKPATVKLALNEGTAILKDALAEYDARGTLEKPDLRSIGKGVAGIVGRNVGGRRLEKAGKTGGVSQYRIVREVACA